MKNNPFTSDTFVSIWLKHFYKKKQVISCGFMSELSFYRSGILKLYVNIGKNLSKGISYSLLAKNMMNFHKKVFLIYDVPTFFGIQTEQSNKKLGLYKVRQYPGYLIDLGKTANLNDYLLSTFSKSSRYKLKKYKNRLELCFDIRYRVFFGDISKDKYDFIFQHFNDLLQKRFSEKQVSNNNLNPGEWNFYYDLVYPMINEKKASLFVVYDGGKPIGVTLNYLSKDILFAAITVFDTDYSKFHLGSIGIMKQIEWCIANQVSILDFSKGHFEYKKKWSNKKYFFEYHIYFDKSWLPSKVLAFFIKNYFITKQVLREKKVNDYIHRLTFKFKKKKSKHKPQDYILNSDLKETSRKNYEQIDHNLPFYQFLRKIIFDFLYLKQENYANLTVYELTNGSGVFILEGKKNKVMAIQKNSGLTKGSSLYSFI